MSQVEQLAHESAEEYFAQKKIKNPSREYRRLYSIYVTNFVSAYETASKNQPTN